MKRHNNKKLLDYISKVIRLEETKLTQERAIKRLEYQISTLGQPRRFSSLGSAIDERYSREYSSRSHADGELLLWASFFIAWVIGSAVHSLLFAVVVFFGFMFFIASLDDNSDNASRERITREETAKRDQEHKLDEKRVQDELLQKEALQQQLEALRAAHAQTAKALAALYSLNIIKDPYRGLVALCSIYQYLDCETCYQLTGFTGAYNKYDHAVEIRQVITRLDKIINCLEQIRENQGMLYGELRHSNRQLELIDSTNREMLATQGQVLRNTELIEYNTRCCAYANSALTGLAYYRELTQ